MSLLCMKTNDMSWQDRTVNIEVMLAPSKSHLLYNKHKGLQTKYKQEYTNLEREKSSYLRSFKTEMRLMERRKELYSKRRNDIIMRRSSLDSRIRSSEGGRASAPPRLETNSIKENSFITEVTPKLRESKSANARTNPDSHFNRFRQAPSKTRVVPLEITDEPMAILSPCPSTRTATPGKPFLERQKSVRFNNLEKFNNKAPSSPKHVELTIEQKIQKFIDTQADFNNREIISLGRRDRVFVTNVDKPDIATRFSGLQLNMMKLENAFDELCTDSTKDGLHKLVKLATKMKASVRNARNSSIVSGTSTHAFTGISSNGNKQSATT